jgi:hypothetical protein
LPAIEGFIQHCRIHGHDSSFVSPTGKNERGRARDSFKKKPSLSVPDVDPGKPSAGITAL